MTVGEFIRWVEDECINLDLELVIYDSGWQNPPTEYRVTRDRFDENDVVELR